MRILIFGIGYWFLLGIAGAQIDEQKKATFIQRFSQVHGVSAEKITAILEEAKYEPSIIERMERPAEGMPWHKYRAIFMTEERIAAGIDFHREYSDQLREIRESTGVPVPIILGILGVETKFGKRKGSYRTLDALYTLAFGYPKRSRFFTRELEEFLLLTEEENLVVTEVLGSYAGAIGYCQFMPSSYRAYAKSYDTGGSRDLVNSAEDAVASIANYLKVHRWKRGEPIASGTIQSPEAAFPGNQGLKPKKTVAYYENLGFMPVEDLQPSAMSTLMAFEQEEKNEYWLGLNNFYVITRYNHSPLYALAVFQLAEAIKKGLED